MMVVARAPGCRFATAARLGKGQLMAIEQPKDTSTALTLSGRACIGLGVFMGGIAVATATVAEQLKLWPALLLGLVLGGTSGTVVYLASRRLWKSRALELLFLVSFIGSVLLGGILWIDQGVSSYLTVFACAAAVVNLIGFVVAVRSRPASSTRNA